MSEEQFASYVAGMQQLIAKLNENLAGIQDAVRKVGASEKITLDLAASAYDMSFLVLVTLSELHVDFRTSLIRRAQEPTANAAAAESRRLLLAVLAESHKASGERPKLTPVPQK